MKKIKLGTLFICLMTASAGNAFERNAGYWSNPGDETSTSFFGKLTDSKSQRENWYAVTPYCAEFWCTLSNIGFLYVGIKENSPELLFAGCASMLSHSIPKRWLLYVDKIGVLLVLSKLLREYKTFYNNPALLLPVAALGGINYLDMHLARKKSITWPHVLWHLSAAFVANFLLTASKKCTS